MISKGNLNEKAAIHSPKHLHNVRIDIGKTPVEVSTQGYGLMIVKDLTAHGPQRLVKYLTPSQKALVLYLTKGTRASLWHFSLRGLQKMSVQIEEKNLSLRFTHPRTLTSVDSELGVGLGMRGEPENGESHAYRIQQNRLKAQVHVKGLVLNLIRGFRIRIHDIGARKMVIFRSIVPAQGAYVSISSLKKSIAIPPFQDHLKNENFDFKFMSLMTKKEVS